MITQDWDVIQETDEYEQDYANILGIIRRSIGNSQTFVDESNLFAIIMTHLLSINRYFLRHNPEMIDIDETLYLDKIQQVIGVDLPLSTTFPIVEFLRESRNWYANKGTRTIFNFIGDLIGSPIEINYPRDLIFIYDSDRTYWDGAVTDHGGELPFEQSKLGRYRDSVFWSQFTYLIKVIQGRNAKDLTNLTNLLDAVHPAGTRRFITVNYATISTGLVQSTISLLGKRIKIRASIIQPPYPTWDNQWTYDAANCWDMFYGDFTLNHSYVRRIKPFDADSCNNRIWNDSNFLTHKNYFGPAWQAFSRDVLNGDGTWTRVYADNDNLVMENVTTNVGLKDLSWKTLKSTTWREIKSVSWGNSQKNMRGMWYPYMLKTKVTHS